MSPGVAASIGRAERTVGQAVQEETLALVERSVWTAAVLHRLKAGRKQSDLEGRLDESEADTQTPLGEAMRGERTVAPCPLIAVQAVIGGAKH